MGNDKGRTESVEFIPLDVEQFRQGFVLFLYVLSGQEKAPPPPETYMDADTGRPLPLVDTIFNRAWTAAGKLFEDEVLRRSFYRRLELFGSSVARDPRYDSYIGFRRPSLHLALVAALARFPFSKGMTEKESIAAFDEELRRQRGAAGEDRAHQTGARLYRNRPPLAIDAASTPSPNSALSTWPPRTRAAVFPSTAPGCDGLGLPAARSISR